MVQHQERLRRGAHVDLWTEHVAGNGAMRDEPTARITPVKNGVTADPTPGVNGATPGTKPDTNGAKPATNGATADTTPVPTTETADAAPREYNAVDRWIIGLAGMSIAIICVLLVFAGFSTAKSILWPGSPSTQATKEPASAAPTQVPQDAVTPPMTPLAPPIALPPPPTFAPPQPTVAPPEAHVPTPTQTPTPTSTVAPPAQNFAVIGSSCLPHSSNGVTADGSVAYCSRIQDSHSTYLWSLSPGDIPFTESTGSASLPSQDPALAVCMAQTGRTESDCRTYLARPSNPGNGSSDYLPGTP